MKRCFLKEKWGNVVRSTGSFMAELFESLIDDVGIEVNMAAAKWSCLTDIHQAIISLFAWRRHRAGIVNCEYRGKIVIEGFSFEFRVASNLVIC